MPTDQYDLKEFFVANWLVFLRAEAAPSRGILASNVKNTKKESSNAICYKCRNTTLSRNTKNIILIDTGLQHNFSMFF